MQKPLISICIPTYNRADYLKETLDSIVLQKRFIESYDVEIIISDNCSTDHTTDVATSMVKIYGDKIKYFRNEVNIFDKNMYSCLSKGNGEFLKLNNDTLKHEDGSLNILAGIVQSNLAQKKVLFFINGAIKGSSITASDLNGFLSKVSFNCTWIGAFGIWREDFENIKDFDRYAKLQLTQTDVLFRVIGSSREVYVNNDILFESVETSRKGGYDIIDVFIDNYTFLLKEAVQRGDITNEVYVNEIKKLLLNFICPWMARITMLKDKFYFTARNGFTRIVHFYRNMPLILFLFFVKYLFGVMFIFIKKTFKIQSYHVK